MLHLGCPELIGIALENGNELFSEGTVTIVDILGKRSIITDSPALVDGTDQKVLCLTANALTVEPNGDLIQMYNLTTVSSELREPISLNGLTI